MEEDEERAARCGTGRGGASERGTETSEDRGTLTWEDRLREGQRGVWTRNGEEWETETQGVGRRRRGRRERPRDKAETQRYTLERGVVRDSQGLSESDVTPRFPLS